MLGFLNGDYPFYSNTNGLRAEECRKKTFESSRGLSFRHDDSGSCCFVGRRRSSRFNGGKQDQYGFGDDMDSTSQGTGAIGSGTAASDAGMIDVDGGADQFRSNSGAESAFEGLRRLME